VKAKDAAGNTDASPAAISWTITSPTSTCSTKVGNTDNDTNNQVNINDILAILSSYGQPSTNNCADANKDGTINMSDISIVLSNYGT
jgi:hypothetical protein